MHDEPKCRNASCRCKVPKERATFGDAFCSEYCVQNAREQGPPPRSCGRGHPACEASG